MTQRGMVVWAVSGWAVLFLVSFAPARVDNTKPLSDRSLAVPRAMSDPIDSISAGSSVEYIVAILDECLVLEVCVDHYLWALYQRTAKLDTNKTYELREVKVRKGKNKTVTVTR